MQFSFEGKDYRRGQFQRDLVNNGVELDGENGLSYTLYSFGGFAPITDLDSLSIGLKSLQPSFTTAQVYIGISNYDFNGWTWFETSLPDFELSVGAGSNYVSANGLLHLAVILDGDAIGEVSGIELVGDNQPEWVEEIVMAIPGVVEPSGICLGPDETTMFIVDDGAAGEPAGIAEVNMAFTMVRRLDLGSDLEGICYCPVDGLLYVADEVAELVYIVNPQTLAQTGSFYYSRSFDGEEVIGPGGDGVEGITFIPDVSVNGGGYFLLLNQNDPTALLRIDRGDINSNPPGNPAPLSCFTLVEQRTAGGLYFDAPKRHLWVIHSWMEFVEVYNIDTMELVSRDNFPGFAQEGATLSPDGKLWICNDTGFLGRYSYKLP